MTRTYSLGEFARLMGVHPKTVQRWDRDGTLTAKRTPTGRRFYTDEDRRRGLGFPEARKRSIAYCRVSSAAQKPDLKNQRQALEQFCISRGIAQVEFLRIAGKIMGAVVKRECDRWFVSVQVEVPEPELPHTAPGSVVGIDLGISTHLSLSQPLPDGRTKIENPKPRRAYARRQRKLQRRISRQELVRRRANAKRSKRQGRRQAQVRKLHYRIGCIRKDAIHKATTVVASAFETIVIEDLNVSGMSKNHALAGSVLDAAFGEIRRQLAYKTKIAGGRVVIADRFFPSSKTCSDCGHVVDALPLHVREWMCPVCGCVHDRDTNAAINLELVGRATPEPAQMPTCGDMEALAVEQPGPRHLPSCA